MTYDWRGEAPFQELTPEWFEEQDRRSAAVHAHFATDSIPFDRLIPYAELAGKEVLEIGIGAGFHSELLTRAGASVTGIDLTEVAIARTRARFALRGLAGSFERRDAEEPDPAFERRFDFIWSWGVVHHSSRTARIVRNVSSWLKDDGSFGGMVYHRDSLVAFASVMREWILRRRLFRESLDEALWRSSDGFSARFYPADQWRDLLLGFFEEASVRVSGQESDVLPLPRVVRVRIQPRIPPAVRSRVLQRAGTFVLFNATRPLR